MIKKLLMLLSNITTKNLRLNPHSFLFRIKDEPGEVPSENMPLAMIRNPFAVYVAVC